MSFISSTCSTYAVSQATVSSSVTPNISFPPSSVKPAPGNRETAKDRFNPVTGARLVAGVVVLSNTVSHPSEEPGKYVLCVSSSRHPNKVVLPKGGWEFNETVEEAALRECWEEAGVSGTVTRFLLRQADSRPPKDYTPQTSAKGSPTGSTASACEYGVNSNGEEVTKYKGLEFTKGNMPSRSEYQYFQVAPTGVYSEWPESDKRIRKWLTYEEAHTAFQGRGEMVKSLELSDIVKD